MKEFKLRQLFIHEYLSLQYHTCLGRDILMKSFPGAWGRELRGWSGAIKIIGPYFSSTFPGRYWAVEMTEELRPARCSRTWRRLAHDSCCQSTLYTTASWRWEANVSTLGKVTISAMTPFQCWLDLVRHKALETLIILKVVDYSFIIRIDPIHLDDTSNTYQQAANVALGEPPF